MSREIIDQWICCQIGAREHYEVPFHFEVAHRLKLLVTDIWSPAGLGLLNKNLAGRKHAGIPNTRVKAFNYSSLLFEASNKMRGLSGWQLVMKRNQWFQQKAVHVLKQRPYVAGCHLFSYSYAAREIFKYAKSRGWKTVLGQIDPGPVEEEIVLEEASRYPRYKSEWQPAPKKYWQEWFEECDLADEIVVNSEWSQAALVKAGIDITKIQIVPLTYQASAASSEFQRVYPGQFTSQRPLRILFLGQVILRKGIARLIETAELLGNEPVQFIIVGPTGISPLPSLPNIQWLDRVPRIEVEKYFRDADVFLFPTLSDGFGLTQLEAKSWSLPAIVTRTCGSVTSDQHNGWVLPDADASSISKVIREILQQPGTLARCAMNLKLTNPVAVNN